MASGAPSPCHARSAAEPRGAVAKLQETGLIPIRVTPTRSAEGRLGLNITRLGIDLFARISHKDVMLFTQDLGVLLEAGLPVDRALSCDPTPTTAIRSLSTAQLLLQPVYLLLAVRIVTLSNRPGPQA